MISRRKFLGGATAAAAATGISLAGGRALAGSSNGSARAAASLPLKVVNNTGQFDDASIFLYILGEVDGKRVHVTPEGEAKPVEMGDNGGDGFTDYAISLSDAGNLQLPYMDGGRIYTGLGDKLKFKAVEDGNGNAALAYPAGWVESDPNWGVLHDCAEFTFKDSGMYCNTTAVDMFSVPLSITLKGQKEQTTGKLKSGGRAQAFEKLAGGPFGDLIVEDKRIIAPSHGIDSGRFPADYLDAYIDEVWSVYSSKDLVVTTNQGEFKGRVSGNTLGFTGPGEVTIEKPSTRDVLFCDGALAAPNDAMGGPVAAIVGAALNRTSLAALASQPTDDPSGFYQGDTVHEYVKVMHEIADDGKAYGFAFDDVAGFAAYIEDGAPTEITLSLDPLK
ncbi:beta-1,3-glucanase family protein [Streptomyces sp. Z26]|uniref:beta-1,3-glucanase family protein n=1 Tax=Streptomyces TaxID=1883 RepID=UPI000EF15758|nr:beta-1,3-glucanase family protein [Streptomyces sp. Z26]RLL66146.1 twin-arginine translocation signal domain-containing protein [Streptomyces sp. Z26]